MENVFEKGNQAIIEDLGLKIRAEFMAMLTLFVLTMIFGVFLFFYSVYSLISFLYIKRI